MALTVTIDRKLIANGCRRIIGRYDNASGSTGGELEVGLRVIWSVTLNPTGSSVTNKPVVNETFPVTGSAVTIVTASNESGTFEAVGL